MVPPYLNTALRSVARLATFSAFFIFFYIIVAGVWYYARTETNIDVNEYATHIKVAIALCAVKVLIDLITPRKAP